MTTPVELYRHGLSLLRANDFAAWVELWAQDCAMEFPFAPPGWPKRLDGRKALAEYLSGYPDHIELHDFPDVRFHETTDPTTIIVELRGVGRLVQSDTTYDMNYVHVVTVLDGKITACRDYWNPLGVPDFTGGAR
ncbi:nuclear transport factor 2 family protein [Allokutzneria sp. NRRL B-24872]|uniref:nuclear transport factor 2 family protein n=1 Tax=Allokutzneria sp. NRRL B-24872 TaxID=1137961 RepID=UPI001AEF9803|nr:nuclear transport factor 2 family protein [Allokutzneria sp. NRRL B-24872]